MSKRYFYLSKCYAKRNSIWVYKESDTKINNYTEIYGTDCQEVFDYSIPNTPWLNEDGRICEMPLSVKIERGVVSLGPGEHVVGECVTYTPPGVNILKPSWDNTNKAWVESASTEDIAKSLKNKSRARIHDSILLATRFLICCEPEDEEHLDEVKCYVRSLYGLSESYSADLDVPPEPVVLSRYKIN